jgi:hypothetical protein
MIRSVRASVAALAATAVIAGCNADEGAGPTPSIASIVAHLDSVVAAAHARGDTVQADFMTAIETPLVFGAPLSFVQVALDTFEVQGTHEVNTEAWDADAYAIVDTTTADTLLVFTAADNDDGTAVLRSAREGSGTAGALIAGDSIYFAPRSPAIHLTATGGNLACRMTVPTSNPAILGLSRARCVQITVDASDTLTTAFPQPGYIAGIWLTRNGVPGVELIR